MEKMKTGVALVTGSTSGIGLGISRSLADNGYSVVITGFGHQELIDCILSELNQPTKGGAHYIPADLSKPEDIEELYKKLKEIHPEGVDVLINNAGFQHVSSIQDFPLEKWNSMMAVMVTAPFILTKLCLPDLKQKGRGRIINIASVHGHVASLNKGPYITAKHGLVGLTKVVALETAGTGVTCNAICPGWVATDLFWNQVDVLAKKKNISREEAKLEIVSEKHPSKECITVEQLADTVKYVCSSAADQMTGSSLVIDGGWTAR
ncbi:D-beta-hydroxybutyrate dehydrogenase-like isoform X1 [Glandiceps talaboti]